MLKDRLKLKGKSEKLKEIARLAATRWWINE